ncbi:MAG TPA: hypothetical protein VJB87_01640 [Candidatus Nanoarchaeia archaeon]|nr:hypothetical protein [Candidatus Nanoarchaeia archaeon]
MTGCEGPLFIQPVYIVTKYHPIFSHANIASTPSWLYALKSEHGLPLSALQGTHEQGGRMTSGIGSLGRLADFLAAQPDILGADIRPDPKSCSLSFRNDDPNRTYRQVFGTFSDAEMSRLGVLVLERIESRVSS